MDKQLNITETKNNQNDIASRFDCQVMLPYYDQDGITIYNADCRTALDSFAPGQFDLCLTDYPYGVNVEYDGYDDSQQNLKQLISETMPSILRVSKRAMITTGVQNIFLFEPAQWIIAWVYGTTNTYGNIGFNSWQPILYYGKCPYLASGQGARMDIINDSKTPEKNGHPCPKPLSAWKKVLLRGSVSTTDVILDPFMGSGTTLVAAKQLGRKAVGIEQSQKYCDIAIKRLAQMELF